MMDSPLRALPEDAKEAQRVFNSLPIERDDQGKGTAKMEIRTGLREWLDSVEGEENKRHQLHAFADFCLDLLGEQYGRIPPEEEIDPRFVKGLLIRT